MIGYCSKGAISCYYNLTKAILIEDILSHFEYAWKINGGSPYKEKRVSSRSLNFFRSSNGLHILFLKWKWKKKRCRFSLTYIFQIFVELFEKHVVVEMEHLLISCKSTIMYHISKEALRVFNDPIPYSIPISIHF